jgi:hypothetical protein
MTAAGRTGKGVVGLLVGRVAETRRFLAQAAGHSLALIELGREQPPSPWLYAAGQQTGIAILELGAGRYEAAMHAALDARALWPQLSPEDAVEAAMRCGRPEVARSALAEFAPPPKPPVLRGPWGSWPAAGR